MGELFKMFPNSFLFKYNDDTEVSDAVLEMPSRKELATLLLYLPSIILWFTLALPVFLCLIVAAVVDGNSRKKLRSRFIAVKLQSFLKRLTAMNDNVEGDFWIRDITPFITKNHVQIPSRLLATLRTGVEWKKIDFAIGKVVE